mgnify:CR=1 FL=1
MKILKTQKWFFKAFLIFSLSSICLSRDKDIENTPPYGYVFKKWGGPPIDVIHYFPPKSNQASPVLVVIPDGERDAQFSHSEWIEIAKKEQVILIALGARKKYFPDDYSYGSGRVISIEGHALHRDQWLFSVIEPLFLDFKTKNNLTQDRFYIVGENEGGGFVHRYLLFNPRGPVLKALAINPDFVTVPDKTISYPFGLKNAPISNQNVKDWLKTNLTILSTVEVQNFKKGSLSNTPLAAIQGNAGNKRGEFLFNFAKDYAKKKKLNLSWSFKKITKTQNNTTPNKQDFFNLLFK